MTEEFDSANTPSVDMALAADTQEKPIDIGDATNETGETGDAGSIAKPQKDKDAKSEAQPDKGKLPPVENEADTSDGSDRDEPGDVYLEIGDLKSRNEDIAKRRKKRDVRRRQHSRYMLLLDDRLEFLEEEVLKLKKEGIKEQEISDPKPAIPELRPMSWAEYALNKGEEVPPVHYAIDLLMEDPVIFQRSSIWLEEGKAKKTNAGTEKAHLDTVKTFGPHLKVMPERIRINAQQLCEALSTSITDGAISFTANSPTILRRPFKALLHHEDSIKQFLASREGLLEEVEKAKSAESPPDDAQLKTSDGKEVARIKEQSSNYSMGGNKEQPPEKGGSSESPDRRLVVYLRLLLSFISDYVKPSKERVPSQPRISFQDLYLLFEPGQLVHLRQNDHPQKVWRLLQVTGGNRFLRQYEAWQESEDPDYKKMKRDPFSQLNLDCYCLVSDGVGFRRVHKRFSVRYFPDDQQMKDVWILPYEIAKQHKLVDEDSLLDNSSQYLDCTSTNKVCHRYYRGRTVDRDSQGRPLKVGVDSSYNRQLFAEKLDGAVIVDFEKAYRHNPEWMPQFNEIEEHRHNNREFESNNDPHFEVVQDDSTWDMRRREQYLDNEEKSGKIEKWEQGVISDDDFLLLPSRVPAFVLRSRKWVYLQLGYEYEGTIRKPRLAEVQVNEGAWNDLQLPGEGQEGGHKEIIQSLVGNHSVELDLVREKGRGLIVLLHGAPGVGKTSTAECVADARGKPLLPITCGDLGLEPELVESNLSRHFELAQSWDCILLLDEADVFLAERSLKDLQRNALVSVFLRILEYYEGILFLTTNKVGLIDEAFKSRIHMSLHYPWLTEDQTKSIWRNLIKKSRQAQPNLRIDETEILIFAMKHMQKLKESPYGKGPDGESPGWNGRQIRNAFMSAISLAQYEAEKSRDPGTTLNQVEVHLTPRHFETVAKASKDFDNYLYRVHAFNSDSKRAEKSNTRYDTSRPSLPEWTTDGKYGQRPGYYENARPVTPVGRHYNTPSMRHNYQPPAQAASYGQMHLQPPAPMQNAPQWQGHYQTAAQQQQQQPSYASPTPQFNPGGPPVHESRQFQPNYQTQEGGQGQPQVSQGQLHQSMEVQQPTPSPEQQQQWNNPRY